VPAPGLLLNISERGALAQVQTTKADAAPWPMHLRQGYELWLSNVIPEPLFCWVVAVERDLVRLRLLNDESVLPDLRALIAQLALDQANPRSLAADKPRGDSLAVNRATT
jgi:hypothetical protein